MLKKISYYVGFQEKRGILQGLYWPNTVLRFSEVQRVRGGGDLAVFRFCVDGLYGAFSPDGGIFKRFLCAGAVAGEPGIHVPEA